jgi:hypothetical protein
MVDRSVALHCTALDCIEIPMHCNLLVLYILLRILTLPMDSLMPGDEQ